MSKKREASPTATSDDVHCGLFVCNQRGRAMNLHQMARAVGGEISGHQVLCPGPGHSRKDGSLAVRMGRDGALIVHSFAGDDWRRCRDYVRERFGLCGPEAARRSPSRLPASSRPARSKNAATGARIWRDARDPRSTLAERYLQGRGLQLPEVDCSWFIRFHKSCFFGQERFPALLSLVRNIETDKPQAIQRTVLNPDGTSVKRNGKTLRMTLGPMAGGAIKTDDDAGVTQGLCIGEGLETTLTGRQLGFAPAWHGLF